MLNYEKSWLFKHEMTLLEIESQIFGTVEEDQVLSSETVSSETESQSASTSEETNLVSVLNFPLMGNVLYRILYRNFMKICVYINQVFFEAHF